MSLKKLRRIFPFASEIFMIFLIDPVTAQISPSPLLTGLYPGIHSLDYTLGILWELPDYTPPDIQGGV